MAEHNFYPKYRPDIDGLRALAILPVVAYHAFPRYAPGGFIGVDIFFVISGYLISLIIFRSLLNNDFSFAEFYAHRIKRIFPALILVTATCYAVGWFALLPDEFKQLGKHIASGMGFVQNFILWKEAGYFDVASELKPLMHLWSLAVEEQFYLIFPLLVWAAWKARLNVLTGVIVLGVISFVLNLKGIDKDAIKTFFAPQTRFWELMAGSVLAYVYGFRAWRPSFTRWIHAGIFNRLIFREVPEEKDRSVLLSSILSFLGLALIVYSIAKYKHTMPYPGVRAVAPVLGAVLLILAGPHAWVNRYILSRKVVVWVGLISYPLYLWHWPLLSFARIVESETPSRNIRIAAVVISFVLATLTYYLIEKRVRYGRSTWRKVAVLSVLAVLVGYVGYNAYTREGINSRFITEDKETSEKIIKITEAWKFSGYPSPNGSWTDDLHGLKGIGDRDGKLVLFVGDSHTQQYENSVDAFYERKLISKKGVLFLYTEFPPRIDEKLIKDPRIEDVALSFYWSYRYGSETVNQPLRCCGSGKNGVVGKYTLPVKSVDEMVSTNSLIDSQIAKLQEYGKRVWIVLDNPFGEELDAHSKIKRSIFGKLEVVSPSNLSLSSAKERTSPVREFLIEIAKRRGVKTINPFESLCDETHCPMFTKDGDLLYKDYDHISLYASKNKSDYLLEIFKSGK